MNNVPFGTVSYIQQMLRTIAGENENVKNIIPDGLFGEETRGSVSSFQKEYGLENTGEVNHDTWNKLVEESSRIRFNNNRNVKMQVFNENRKPINRGEKRSDLYVIQAMIVALSDKFQNIGTIYVTGIYDAPTERAVQDIKVLSGITPGSIIDPEFINALTELYNANITQNRVENSSSR